MAVHPDRGRVYRRCDCRDANGKQFGARCPKLNRNTRHGSWAYAVDFPSANGRRRQQCRSGFPTRKAARQALEHALECERTGLDLRTT